MSEYGLDDIGSYECGEEISFDLCSDAEDGDCTSGEGPVTAFDSGLDKDTVLVTLKVKEPATNFASFYDKSNALFNKMNLSSDADIADNSDSSCDSDSESCSESSESSSSSSSSSSGSDCDCDDPDCEDPDCSSCSACQPVSPCDCSNPDCEDPDCASCEAC